jgi:hypothetical protein
MGTSDLSALRVENAVDEDDELQRRLEKHGSRGLVKVASTEGASVPAEAAKNLIPAG